MKKKLLLFTLSILIFSCSSDENTGSENENPDNSGIDPINFENIAGFSVTISTPEKERDFTYHNQGNQGIFEDSNSKTFFKGEVKLEYINNSNPVPPEKINVKWHSKIDGAIFEGNINEQYESSFEKALSKGVHKIYFEASIGENQDLIVKDSVILTNAMSLKLEPTDRSVKLNWTRYEGDDFQSYLIYREDFEPIVEISDVNILQYEDSTATLAQLHKFQIVVKTLNNENAIMGSNIEEGEAGKYIKTPHFITKTIYDRSRKKVYAIVGEQYHSSDYANEYGLIILNDKSEVVEVDSHILKEYRFSDLDISPDGKYLFLCQRLVDEITRLDLNTLEVTKFDVASYGWGIHKIEVGNNYRLYCHRTPPTSGDSPLFILDGINGEQVGFYNWMIHGDIEFNIHNNKLYHSTSVREKWVIKFSVDDDNVVREKTFSPNIWWPKSFVLLSESGEHIFWEQFHLDKGLNVVREFDNPIIACDMNDSYISDGQKLMAFNDLTTVFEYPEFPNHELSSEVFTNDNSILFTKSSQPYTNERFTHFFKMAIE